MWIKTTSSRYVLSQVDKNHIWLPLSDEYSSKGLTVGPKIQFQNTPRSDAMKKMGTKLTFWVSRVLWLTSVALGSFVNIALDSFIGYFHIDSSHLRDGAKITLK